MKITYCVLSETQGKHSIGSPKPKNVVNSSYRQLEGVNVRLTIRNHTLVRLEKRRNQDKIQKAKRIIEPWYVDADEAAPADKHLWNAARNIDLSQVSDGE